MKKTTCLLLAAMMTLCLTAAAVAENQLPQYYDAACELLFDTANVTLTGHAEFSLDGKRFKTADGFYQQDGENSLWRWMLHSPGMNGTERENGYTVIANGEFRYVMETFYPGVYKTMTDEATGTIVRQSVQMKAVTEFVGQLLSEFDALLGEQAVTAVSGTETKVTLDENVPERVNTALNLVAQYVVKRYFAIDYDYMNPDYAGLLENYNTTTQAIMGATKSFSLHKAEVTLKREENGQIEQVKGGFSVTLHTAWDGDKMLEGSFQLDVSDRGSTSVQRFDPAAWGVTLAEGAMELEN